MAFNVVAQLQLQAPSTAALNNVASQIQNSLKGITANINVQISPTTGGNISTLNRQLTLVNNNLRLVTSSATTAAQAIANLGKAFATANNQINGGSSATKALNASAASAAKSLDDAKNATEDFGRAAGLAGRRFAGFSLVAGTILSITTALKTGVTEALKYEREFLKLSQLGGVTARELSDLNNEVTKLSTSLGVSSQDLVATSVTLRQAGFSVKEVKDAMKALAETTLAPTFDNIKDSTEGAIAILAQFKLQTNQLTDAFGSINAVSAAFAVESKDVVQAVQRAGGAFRTTGGDLNEFIALFTSVRATTRESAESISTGLRTVFTRFQRAETVEQLKELGINLRFTREEAIALGNTSLENQFVGAFESVKRLSEGLKDLRSTDPRFAAVIEQLGGYRQISRVIPLIQEFSSAQKALTIAQSGNISVTVAAEKAQDNFIVKIQKVKEEFLALGRTLTASDAFSGFLNTTLRLASAFLKITEALSPLIPLLTTLTTLKLASSASSFFTGVGGGFSGIGPKRLATGGLVGGSGSGDTVPAMLTPGEFVVKKSSARSIGYDNLHKMNAKGYAEGGIVTPFSQVGAGKQKFRVGNYDLSENNVKFLYQLAAAQDGGKSLIGKNQVALKGLFGPGPDKGEYANANQVFSKLGFTVNSKTGVVQTLTELRKTLDSNKQFVKDRKAGNFVNNGNLLLPFKGETIGYIASGTPGGEAGKQGRDTLNAGLRTEKVDTSSISSKTSKATKALLENANIKTVTGGVNVHILGSTPTEDFQSEVVGAIEQSIQGIYQSKFGDGKVAPISRAQTNAISGYMFEKYIEGISGRFTAGNESAFEYAKGEKPGPTLGKAFNKFVFPQPVNETYLDLKSRYQKENTSDVIKKYLNTKTADGGLATLLSPEINKARGVPSLAQKPNDDDKKLKLATGGVVPGRGNSDTVPAMLTPGEFVIKKSSAQAIGYERLNSLNKGGVVQRFADGGVVKLKRGQTIGQISYTEGEGSSRTVGINPTSVPLDNLSNSIFSKSLDAYIGSNASAELSNSLKNAKTSQEKSLALGAFKVDKAQIQLYKNKIIGKYSANADVSNLVLDTDKENILKQENSLLDNIGAAVSNEIKNITSKTPKTNPLKDQNFRDTISGFLLEAIISSYSGFAASGGNSPVDFNKIPEDSLKRLSKFVKSPGAIPNNLDAKRSPVAPKKITEKALNAGLFNIKPILDEIQGRSFTTTGSGVNIGGRKTSTAGFDRIVDNVTNKKQKFFAKGGTVEDRRRDVVNSLLPPPDTLEASPFMDKKKETIADKVRRLYGSKVVTGGRLISAVANIIAGGGSESDIAKYVANQESAYRNQSIISRNRGYARGGSVSDTVPAMLTPGEFVVNKKAASRIGLGTLNSMNKTGVAHFAKGGPVGVQSFASGGTVDFSSPTLGKEFAEAVKELVRSNKELTASQAKYVQAQSDLKAGKISQQTFDEAKTRFRTDLTNTNDVSRQQIIKNSIDAEAKRVQAINKGVTVEESYRIAKENAIKALNQTTQSQKKQAQLENYVANANPAEPKQNRFGQLAGVGLAVASSYLAPSFELKPDDIQKLAESGQNSGLRGGASGAITGAGVGAAVAGPYGAAAGALLGFIDGLDETNKKIRAVKLEKTLSDLDNKLKKFNSGDTSIERKGILNDLRSGISSVEESNNNPNTFLERFKANLTTTRLFNGDKSGEEIDKANTKALRLQFADRLPAIYEFLENDFKKVGNDFVKNAGKDLSPEALKNEFDRIGKDFAKGGDGLNSELLNLASRIQGIPVEELIAKFRKAAVQAAFDERIKSEVNKAKVVEATYTANFNRLADAVQTAADSLGSLQSTANNLSNLFDNNLSAIQLRSSASGLSNVSSIDQSSFKRGVRDTAGLFGGNSLGVVKFGDELSNVASKLQSALTTALNNSPVDEQDIGQTVRDLLKNSISGPSNVDRDAIISSITASIPKTDDLRNRLRSNPGQVVDELINTVGGAFIKALKDADKAFTDQANQFITSLSQASIRAQKIGQEQDKLSDIGVAVARNAGQRRAEAAGRRDSINFVSYDDLNAPILNRAQRLSGLGVNAEDPAAVAARLNKTQKDIDAAIQRRDTARTNLNPDNRNSVEEFKKASENLAKLQADANNLSTALKDLTDASTRSAAAQEKLQEIENQRSSRLGVGQQFYGSNAEGRRDINRNLAAALRVFSKGTFDNSSTEEQNRAVKGFGILGDVRSGLLGGKSGKEALDEITKNSKAGIFGLTQQQETESEKYKKIVDENLKKAQTAQQLYIDNLKDTNKSLDDNMRKTFDEFINNLRKTLNEAQTQEKENKRGAAEADKAVQVAGAKRVATGLGGIVGGAAFDEKTGKFTNSGEAQKTIDELVPRIEDIKKLGENVRQTNGLSSVDLTKPEINDKFIKYTLDNYQKLAAGGGDGTIRPDQYFRARNEALKKTFTESGVNNDVVLDKLVNNFNRIDGIEGNTRFNQGRLNESLQERLAPDEVKRFSDLYEANRKNIKADNPDSNKFEIAAEALRITKQAFIGESSQGILNNSIKDISASTAPFDNIKGLNKEALKKKLSTVEGQNEVIAAIEAGKKGGIGSFEKAIGDSTKVINELTESINKLKGVVSGGENFVGPNLLAPAEAIGFPRRVLEQAPQPRDVISDYKKDVNLRDIGKPTTTTNNQIPEGGKKIGPNVFDKNGNLVTGYQTPITNAKPVSSNPPSLPAQPVPDGGKKIGPNVFDKNGNLVDTPIIKDKNKDNNSVGVNGNFSVFADAVNIFNTTAVILADALKAFPSTITGNFTHDVNVNFTGAEIFDAISPELTKLAERTTVKVLNRYIETNMPDAGKIEPIG